VKIHPHTLASDFLVNRALRFGDFELVPRTRDGLDPQGWLVVAATQNDVQCFAGGQVACVDNDPDGFAHGVSLEDRRVSGGGLQRRQNPWHPVGQSQRLTRFGAALSAEHTQEAQRQRPNARTNPINKIHNSIILLQITIILIIRGSLFAKVSFLKFT
jgi:hypothetical protein